MLSLLYPHLYLHLYSVFPAMARSALVQHYTPLYDTVLYWWDTADVLRWLLVLVGWIPLQDVSLLTIEEGIFEVKSTAGDTHLGGERWGCCSQAQDSTVQYSVLHTLLYVQTRTSTVQNSTERQCIVLIWAYHTMRQI